MFVSVTVGHCNIHNLHSSFLQLKRFQRSLRWFPPTSPVLPVALCCACLSRCVGAGEPSRRPGGPRLLLHRRVLRQILGERRSQSRTRQVGGFHAWKMRGEELTQGRSCRVTLSCVDLLLTAASLRQNKSFSKQELKNLSNDFLQL